ncbi:MAG: hypothetical protein HY052_03290 [Proteobacteria bacterium]|nr:hypothetical protein [Pseudomonadota bacterium]
MPPKTLKLAIAVILAPCLLLIGGCLPNLGVPRQTLAVELPPSSRSSGQHQGPPLFCKAGRGTALFGADWDDFSDVLFMLYSGERASVRVVRAHSSEGITIQAFFDHDGQKLMFCPVMDGAPDQRIACASLYVLDDDLNAGIKRTFDIPNALRGGAITCAYQQSHLRKLISYSTGAN